MAKGDIIIRFRADAKEVTGVASKIANAIRKLVTAVQELHARVKGINDLAKSFQRLSKAVMAGQAGFKAFASMMRVLGTIDLTQMRSMVTAMGMLGIAMRGLKKELPVIRALASMLHELNVIMASTRKAATGKTQAVTAQTVAEKTATVASRAFSVTLRVLGQSFVILGESISRAGQFINRFSFYLSRVARDMQSMLINTMRSSVLVLQQFGSAIRMVGQALLNFGMTMSFFIAMPVGRALKAGAEAAISFEDALVKIKKTTDMSWEAVGRLTDAVDLFSIKLGDLDKVSLSSISAGLETMSGQLLKMAAMTPTPINDLAELAEEAGRLGIEGTKGIMDFVRAADMIGVATDINAKDAIKVFSRLANATGLLRDEFGELRKDAGSNMMRLASVVNELENNIMGSASEITQAMERMIGAASQFDIPAQSIAAFAATLIEAGFTSTTAGTMFERMTTYMAVNADKLATAMGVSTAEIRRRMDEDVVNALLGVISSFGDMESSAEAAALASEIFGVRAERAVVVLANMQERLKTLLEDSNTEFASGASLATEYYEALSSTANQVKIFKNNLQIAAVILGRDFLPTINRAMQIGVAVVREFLKWWEKVPTSTKLTIAAVAGLAVIIPPLAIAFGSLLFVVGMFISALGTLAGMFVSLAGVIASIFVPVVGMMTAALMLVPDTMRTVLDSIKGVVDGLKISAASWGEGIVASLAQGMINGVSWIIDAAVFIANAIARLFRGKSPPEEGPLSAIDQWGTALMNTLLRGFMLADFDILEGAGRIIKGFFETMGVGGDSKSALADAILGAREHIKSLIDMFNRTGEISNTILTRISNLFGDVGNDISRLLSLQLQLNGAIARQTELEDALEAARDKKEDVEDSYQAEIRAIAASGKSASERSRLFMEARRNRRRALAAADDEIDAAEDAVESQRDVVDELRTQVDWQQELVNSLLEEARLRTTVDNVVSSTASTLSDIAGAAGDIADTLSGLEFPGLPPIDSDYADIFGDIALMGGDIARAFEEAELAVRIFLAAIRGEQPPPEAVVPSGQVPEGYDRYGGQRPEETGVPQFASPLLENAYNLGVSIRDIYDDVALRISEVVGYFTDLGIEIGKAKEAIDDSNTPLGTFVGHLMEINPLALILVGLISTSLLRYIGVLGQMFGFLLIPLGGVVKLLGKAVIFVGNLVKPAEAAGGATSILGKAMKRLGVSAGAVGIALLFASLVFATVVRNWEKYKDKIVEIADTIKRAFALSTEQPTGATRPGGMGEIIPIMGDVPTELGASLSRLGESLGRLGDLLTTVAEPIIGFFTELMDIVISGGLDNLPSIIDDIATALGGLADIISGGIDIVTILAEGLFGGGDKSDIDARFAEARDTLIGGIDTLLDGLAELYVDVAIGTWLSIADQIIEKITGEKGKLREAFDKYFKYGLENMGKIWGQIITDAGIILDHFWQSVKKWGHEVWESIKKPFVDAYNDLVGKSIVPDIVDGILGFFGDLWTGIKTAGKDIWTSITGWFEDIYTDVTAWVSDMVIEAQRLIDEWTGEGGVLQTALDGIKTAFTTTFESIKSIIVTTLGSAINRAIGFLQTAINGAIDLVNTIGSITGIHLEPITLPTVNWTGFAAGGIVTGPMLAMVGEAGAEAIIPLRLLPDIIADAFGGGMKQEINVYIDRVDASDQDDVNNMVDMIAARLGGNSLISARLGVGGRI